MNEKQIKELRAHAGKLVAEGKPLSGVFESILLGQWIEWEQEASVPNFADGREWRIAKPKNQLIDLSHPFFKWCATNYGELVFISHQNAAFLLASSAIKGNSKRLIGARLVAPSNEHANWQPFFSTPENDAKLRELAKMVKVEVRYWCGFTEQYEKRELESTDTRYIFINNYRITGECQDGWTDSPEEAV